MNFLNENPVKTREDTAEIMKLLEWHKLKCEDVKCICLKSDDFIGVFRESNKQSSNIFYLDNSTFKKIKNFIRENAASFSQRSSI